MVVGSSQGASVVCGGLSARQCEQHGPQHESGGEKPEPVRKVPSGEEDRGRQPSNAPAELLRQHLVRGQILAAKIAGEEQERDDDAPDEVAEHELQESQIGAEGEPRQADNRHRAGLGGNHRSHDHHPGRSSADG